MRDRIRPTRARTERPFGVNFVLQWDQHERVRECVQEPVAVVSTFWGDPAPYVDAIRAGGALHVHTVGCAEEARRAVDAGVDVVVAQGREAGGRVRGEVTTMALVPAVVDAVRPVPVLAAGGVADGRGLAAVLALGADAGWLGTRFLLAHEASVHDEWRRRIQDAAETSSCTRRSSTAARRTRRRARCATAPCGRGSGPAGLSPRGARAKGTSSPAHPEAAPCTATAPPPRSAARLATWRRWRSTPAQGAGIVNDVLPAAAIVAELVSGVANLPARTHPGR